MAQVVAHLIGSEEVTGPSPVSSLSLNLDFSGFIFYMLYFVLYLKSVLNIKISRFYLLILYITVESPDTYFSAYNSFYLSGGIYN